MGGFSHGRGGKNVFAAHDRAVQNYVIAKLHIQQQLGHGRFGLHCKNQTYHVILLLGIHMDHHTFDLLELESNGNV
jgi:hypothetical protein